MVSFILHSYSVALYVGPRVTKNKKELKTFLGNDIKLTV